MDLYAFSDVAFRATGTIGVSEFDIFPYMQHEGMVACIPREGDSMSVVTLEKARQTKQRVTDLFGRYGKVVGTGIITVDDGYGIKINLLDEPPHGIVLPDRVEGVPVKVEVVGPVKPLAL